MKNDLYYIKKKYGENMAHLCRKLFPTILEENGKLFSLLKEHFDYNKNLYKDIVDNNLESDFYCYITSFLIENNDEITEINETPFELMNKAGYNLYKCETYKDTLEYKKYYIPGERLCTFNDENRVNNYDVYFAVKKDVDNIKRENFKNPNRQDEYGTSVISIQFSKEYNQVSIKNRYNHTVANPDATFSNNLDNIIFGLQESFNKYYNYNVEKSNLEIRNYVSVNNKYYHYNIEKDNIYYCSNNVIIDNDKVIKYDSSRYLVFETFILDTKEKKIFSYKKSPLTDSFINTIPKINKIEILSDKGNKKIVINKEIEIDLDSNSNIIGYKNNIAENIEDDFLRLNETLINLEMNNVKTIKNHFLSRNKSIHDIKLKSVESIGDCFLNNTVGIEEIDLPNVKKIGSDFLIYAYFLKKLSMPNLEEVGDSFILSGFSLSYLYFPNLTHVGDAFIRQNVGVKEVYMPKLQEAGNEFLLCNNELKRIVFPNLNSVGSNFMDENHSISMCIMPKLECTGDFFLSRNTNLKSLHLQNLKCVGSYFLYNTKIKYLLLPNISFTFDNFLGNNKDIEFAYLPKLELGENSILSSDNIKTITKRK